MENKFERLHRLILIILLFISIGLAFFGVIISIIDLMALEKLGVFEAILILIGNILNCFISFFAIYVTFRSYQDGSTFMKELVIDSRKNPKKRAQIIFLVIGILFLIAFIVSILMYVGIINANVFPKGLDAAMIAFSFLLFVMGLSFYTYPFFIKKDNINKK